MGTDRAPKRQQEDIIYELHVKEFSWTGARDFRGVKGNVPRVYSGGYYPVRGWRPPNRNRYLKELGVTHIQLMPVYDFGSVDEAGDRDQFNWGYDRSATMCRKAPIPPIPPTGGADKGTEGGWCRRCTGTVFGSSWTWFTTTPTRRTLPSSGLYPGITTARRKTERSPTAPDAAMIFAAEREMAASFILDSVLYWTEEYHMDGFRFDLMGLLPTELMNGSRKSWINGTHG